MAEAAAETEVSRVRGPQDQPETIKETLISIVIAFTMAFVFRGFVIEAFVIPTGSMAPTLMGAHMKFHGRETGVDWAVNPWDALAGNMNEYQNPQDGRSIATPSPGITVHDPISGEAVHKAKVPLHSGDRILVLKYLYVLLEPRRYDVVVFKNPTNPSQNYIKRLIGLPGEQVAIVDGDVFTRKASEEAKGAGGSEKNIWAQAGWRIARKSALEQRATWQTVFDAGEASPRASADRTPWMCMSPDSPFKIEGRAYEFVGGESELIFDQTRTRVNDFSSPLYRVQQTWAIDDYYPYNEDPRGNKARFPVSDVRVRLAIEPTGESKAESVLTARLNVRGHEFEMVVGGGRAEIRERAVVGGGGVKGEWKLMAQGAGRGPEFAAGRATNVEFWHSDQSLSIWVEREKVVEYGYDWTPADRVLFATGQSVEQIEEESNGNTSGRRGLADGSMYIRPDVRLGVSGGACRLHRLALDRDLHYQAGLYASGTGVKPAHATAPESTLTLGKDDFFVCGDNSPNSLDARLWSSVDPWVDFEFRPEAGKAIQLGVVPRELMLGKAFFVYLPSIRYEAKPVPVPDFGRMRFIW